MLKNILKIDGAAEMQSSQQKQVSGGRLTPTRDCSVICVNASAGTSCGPSHCPGVCDGRGGWINL